MVEVHRKKEKVLFNVTHDVKLVQKAAKLLRFIAVPLRFFSYYWRASFNVATCLPCFRSFLGSSIGTILCPWQHSESRSELGQTRTSSSVNKKSPDLTKLQLVPARALLPHASLALVCFFLLSFCCCCTLSFTFRHAHLFTCTHTRTHAVLEASLSSWPVKNKAEHLIMQPAFNVGFL